MTTNVQLTQLAAITTSSGAGLVNTLSLYRNGIAVETRAFPMLDANIALVLSLLAPINCGTVSDSQVCSFVAGDTLQLRLQLPIPVSFNVDSTLSVILLSP